MKPPQPEHRFGNELEAHLKPLEIVFVKRRVVLAEYAKLKLSDAENHICVDPRVGIARAGLSGAVKRFGGDEHFEFAGRVIVLRERAVCP
jgi:hypothetical protein